MVSIEAPATVKAGNTFDVKINIGMVTGLAAYQLELEYNKSVIEVVGEDFGQQGPGQIGAKQFPSLFAFVPQGVQGKIRVIGSTGATALTGQGYLAVIHFTVKGANGQTSDLRLSKVTLFNINMDNPKTELDESIIPSITGGPVTVRVSS